MSEKKIIRVCVIGAGTAGLSAIKNSLEHDLEVVCYEQSDQIGGTWVYRDSDPTVQCDEDVHSSLYQDLRTNLPKEIMGYPDYPYPKKFKLSFVSSDEVLEYLNMYADHFNLKQYINFNHKVIRVKPHQEKGWEVYVLNLETDKLNQIYFDRIFVCNGHYTKPKFPSIPGMDIYTGIKMHSHMYRSPQNLKDKTVLIIGAGPSGMDLANHISKTAKQVFLSHHLRDAPATDFMITVTQKGDVKNFTKTSAVFDDGSTEQIDCVIYCTGYQYSFPFLSCDCGIYVQNNHVQSLYKHCINIEYPTMAIIGVPFLVLPTQCFDLQIRFVLKFFKNELEFPSKGDMMKDLKEDLKGRNQYDAHKMGEKQYAYYEELSNMASIANIKPVMTNIMKECARKYINELETYRSHIFEVVDDENFTKKSTE